MPIPLLPRLKSECSIAIEKNGEWISTSQNTLPNLIDSLQVSANDNSDISSIPDVWARPVLCENILFNSKHNLHQKYLDEWRGLLAIIALRKLRGFDGIKLESIDIPAISKLKDSDSEFLKVISKSLPKSYQNRQDDPTLQAGQIGKIQLIVYNDTPLAILWPSILVCPALELVNNRIIDIPWWKHDGINNPIPDLSYEEKRLFYFWLKTEIIESGRIKDNSLMDLLSVYRDDLLESLGDDFDPQVKPNLVDGSAYKLDITGACSIIGKPIMGAMDDFIRKSNVKLVNRRHSHAKDLLLFTMDIDKQWNLKASEIVLGGPITASAVPFKSTGVIIDNNKLGDVDLTKYHVEIHMANDFFTDKLAIIHMEHNVFPHALGSLVISAKENGKVNVILPIKESLLDYLDIEYISKHVRIDSIENGFEATMELPVSGPHLDNNEIIITKKKYLKDSSHDEIIDYDDAPILQIWPNFILDPPTNWQAYFSYYDNSDMPHTFYAEPSWKKQEIRPLTHGSFIREICRGDSFPEAYICSDFMESDLSGEANKFNVGLILLNKPPVSSIVPTPKLCKIGVDFGTTNTLAFMSFEDENQPRLLKFQNRLYNVVQDDSKKDVSIEANHSLRRNFISPFEQPNGSSTSIRTMFHTHLENFNGDIDQMLFRGNVYFLDASANISKDQYLLSTIHSDDMKWDKSFSSSGGTAAFDNLKGFLMQVCVQCMAEAICSGANRIKWIYSYPRSFNRSKKIAYESMWINSIAKELKRIAPMNCNESEIDKEQESVAMAEYFADPNTMNAAINTGIVCLDIGGGSTDIAVWQGTNGDVSDIRHQTSVIFAGRNILNDYLWNKNKSGSSIFEDLKTHDSEFNDELNMLTKNKSNKHEFDLRLEAVLKYHEKKIFDSLSSKRMLSNVSLMIRDITFALSGLLFYSGMIVGHLRRQNKYDEMEDFPNCYIGGNGSKLLNWIACGIFKTDGGINDVLRGCFSYGVVVMDPDCEENDNFDIYRTKFPKQEVAYGLVCDTSIKELDIPKGKSGKHHHNNNDVMIDEETVFAGEKFLVNKNLITDKAEITSQDIINIVQIDKNIPIFKEFLSEFNYQIKKVGYEEINISEKQFVKINSDVNKLLVDKAHEANGNKENVEVEPLFVLILKTVHLFLAKGMI